MKDSTKDNFVYDGYAALAERTIKRLWILCILLVVLLVGTNAGWIWYEAQFEDSITTQTVEQDAENGTNSFVGGDVINGEAENNHNNKNEETKDGR